MARLFCQNLWRDRHLKLSLKEQRSSAAEPFANGTNNNYVEEMYRSWLQDPKSVHAVSIDKNIIYFNVPVLQLKKRC